MSVGAAGVELADSSRGEMSCYTSTACGSSMLLPPRNFAGNLSCLECCLDSVSIGRAVGLGLGNFDSVSCQDAYSSLLGQARSWWPEYSAENVNVPLVRKCVSSVDGFIRASVLTLLFLNII